LTGARAPGAWKWVERASTLADCGLRDTLLHVRRMSTLSGLSDTVRAFTGRTLSMRLEFGWGWSVHTAGSEEAAPFTQIDDVNLTTVQVIPSEFFAAYGASTRGFLGRVVQPGHPLHDLPVLAFTMSDGLAHDFTSHICHAWRSGNKGFYHIFHPDVSPGTDYFLPITYYRCKDAGFYTGSVKIIVANHQRIGKDRGVGGVGSLPRR
jgi:hypothetical protein